MNNEHTQLLGVVTPDELYTLQAFKKRIGIEDATLRAARRAGLRVIYVHKKGFILGKDWIQYAIDANHDGTTRPTSDRE